jgi:peptide-methionine (R)-S-oxide reductase
LDHIKIIKILNKHQILDQYRYVDDILIIYNKNITNIEKSLNEFNTVHPKINFTIEKETHNTLNYIDLTITNNHNKLTFDIYRKPTNRDIILHNDFCHPNKNKKSAIAYLVNRMTTYPITLDKNFEN